MTSARMAILQALNARLSALPAKALRGEVLPERIPSDAVVILRDGDPGDPEVTLSPPRFHDEHRAEIEVIVAPRQPAGRDEALDELLAAIGNAIAADRTLGGLCDWVEASAPKPVDLPVDGAATMKAAVVPITLTYSAADPLG